MDIIYKFGKLSLPSSLSSNFKSLLDWINISSEFTTDKNFFNRYIDEFNYVLKNYLDTLNTSTKNSRFEGNVWIDKSAKILPGVIIEGPCIIGPDSIIGPNAYIRPGTIIGKGVRLGHGAEINSSIMFDKSQMRHIGYVGKSLIGESTKIGAGTIFSTMRNDDKYIKIFNPNGSCKTHLHKVGAFVEKESRIGINVSIMPGTWIRASSKLSPSSLVRGLI